MAVVFALIFAVAFAASTVFITPVGYQTTLLVDGPGGYRFTDYLILSAIPSDRYSAPQSVDIRQGSIIDSIRVGGPLQAVFAVVTALGIAFFWGL